MQEKQEFNFRELGLVLVMCFVQWLIQSDMLLQRYTLCCDHRKIYIVWEEQQPGCLNPRTSKCRTPRLRNDYVVPQMIRRQDIQRYRINYQIIFHNRTGSSQGRMAYRRLSARTETKTQTDSQLVGWEKVYSEISFHLYTLLPGEESHGYLLLAFVSFLSARRATAALGEGFLL